MVRSQAVGVSTNRDIVIAGGGVAGLALALALKQAAGRHLSIALHDPAFARPAGGDTRAFAMSAGARRMLTTLGVWDSIAAMSQPILAMDITDSRADAPVRPLFLSFGGEIGPGEPFAHMVESGPLTDALRNAALSAGVELDLRPVNDLAIDGDGVLARIAEDVTVRTRLLVAADGGKSRLRERAGISFYGWTYDQSAIVGTISHERDHEGRAVEHFLPSGPFALLPLAGGRRSSIVWTERTLDVPRILARDPADQAAMIERRFGLTLGDIRIHAPLRALPLTLGIARDFTAERLALLG
ncbi:MAG: FAD-dependent monooxygenase, partial [Beijerinckiaceae bacterium]